MSRHPALFQNVALRDYLGFWADQTLNVRGVAEFLDLKKPDLARVAGVQPSSVRFDSKMPRQVLDRLTEIANICALVAEFFAGDVSKTALWFQTRNTLLGDITPRDMIRYGRYAKLHEFVMSALDENQTASRSTESERARATTAPSTA